MGSTIDVCSKNYCGAESQHLKPFKRDVKLQGKKPDEMEEVQKLEGMLEGKVRTPQLPYSTVSYL